MKFNTWLNRRRLEGAENLLRFQPELTMEAIAERTGFSTSKYFIESFKKLKGISPLQYRKTLETQNSEA